MGFAIFSKMYVYGRIPALFFTMKGKILEFRIGNFLVFVESYAHRFPVWAERSIKNSFLAFGLGGVWDARYQAWIFPNSPSRIHFCFLSGHWDEHLENDQSLWQFGYQLSLARARMRKFSGFKDEKSLWQFGHQQNSARARMRDFYDEDFTPAIELSDDELNAIIPF